MCRTGLEAIPDVAVGPVLTLLAAMRSLAVLLVVMCILCTELLQLRQECDKASHAFSARLRGKAEACTNTVCECGKTVDYTSHIIRDVLINGIHDSDIRRDIVNDVLALVENREMARNALPLSTHSYLHPVDLSLSVANRSPIAIKESFFARFSTAPSGGITSCRSMVYTSSSIRAMYLSYVVVPPLPAPSGVSIVRQWGRIRCWLSPGLPVHWMGLHLLLPPDPQMAGMEA